MLPLLQVTQQLANTKLEVVLICGSARSNTAAAAGSRCCAAGKNSGTKSATASTRSIAPAFPISSLRFDGNPWS